MTNFVCSILFSIFILAKYSYQLKARCFMIPDTNVQQKGYNSGVSGEVSFSQNNETSPVYISLKVFGAKKIHGFHIHETGSIEQGCVSAGAHYNPDLMVHGGPNSTVRHIGDLGNVESDNDKNIIYSYTNNKISLYGDKSIIGKSCVIHAGEDDLGLGGNEESTKTGNSGYRLACGVVQSYDPIYSIVFGLTLLIVGVGLSFYYFFYIRKDEHNRVPNTLVENEVKNG